MRAAAEVDEVAIAIEADLVAGRSEPGDEVSLHEVAVAREFGEGPFAGFVLADEGLIAGDDFGHFGFDGGEVFGGEGLLAVEVVEEAGVGGGAVTELGFGKLEDGRSQNVRAIPSRSFSASPPGRKRDNRLPLRTTGARRSLSLVAGPRLAVSFSAAAEKVAVFNLSPAEHHASEMRMPE